MSVVDSKPRSAVEQVLSELDVFLRDVKGLRLSTRERYARDLLPILVAKYGERPVDFAELSIVEVRELVADHSARRAPRTTKALTTALRSLFRFLAVSGRSGATLDSAVPTIRSSRLAHVPYGLDEQQLKQLIRTMDRSRPTDLRAAAMVQCLAILGKRAGEVAALRLDDVDWRTGTIRLRTSKTRHAGMLPLPSRVGRLLADYLRHGRPKTNDRHVFVRHRQYAGQPLRSHNVSHAIGRVMRRTGLDLPSTGAHILRHTAAGRLVRAGAKMKEVADLLRHRGLETVRIYTKVDWPRLAEVALPWPTEVE